MGLALRWRCSCWAAGSWPTPGERGDPMNVRLVSFLGGLALLSLVVGAWGGSEPAAGSLRDTGAGADEARAAALAQGDGGAASGISVSGQGVAVAEPDIASLALGVSTLADSARQARDDAAESMTARIASLPED